MKNYNRFIPFLLGIFWVAIFASPCFLQAQTETQNVGSNPDSTANNAEFHRNVDIGFGFGLDYGGLLGAKVEFVPISHLGVFVSGGILLSGFGWQFGAIGYIIKKTNQNKVRPYGKFMYGTNASIYVENKEEYNEIYLGPSLGAGCEFRFGKKRNNGLNVDLNFPFRSQQYQDDWDVVKNDPSVEILAEPWAFTISIGYHFEF